MFIATFFIIAKKKGNPNVYQLMNKVWYSNTTEYYLSINRNEVQIHVTKWVNFENVMLS